MVFRTPILRLCQFFAGESLKQNRYLEGEAWLVNKTYVEPKLDYWYFKFVYLATVGFTTGLILAYLDGVFVGLRILLRARKLFYVCAFFETRADDFLRVRILKCLNAM